MTMRALVVDDSRAMRTIVGRIVKEIGFEVIEAGNGQEALERLATSQVALALVDWNMPVMNGLDFVTAVRQGERHQDLRIVMVTTESEMGRVAAAIEAGAHEFVMKPFTKEVLIEKLALIGISALETAPGERA